MSYMNKNHESPKQRRVSEPVQVYLGQSDADRLERLTDELRTTKSDVLRRGLAALERETQDPSRDPLLRLIGLAGKSDAAGPGYDEAVEHDRFLAESEEESWTNQDPAE